MTAEAEAVFGVGIDSASDLAGVALFEGDQLLAELTWRTRRNHSRELLPALDWLLQHTGRDKHQLQAVYVCTGPGSYAGLRVGLSTAKSLAYGLEVPIVGVGRLEAEALPVVEARGGRVVAVQAAGRAELAWAAYGAGDLGLIELSAPRLVSSADFAAVLEAGDAVTGDVDQVEAMAAGNGFRADDFAVVRPPTGRVVAVARLGYQRLLRGDIDSADTLVPLYLRAPAIGPQPPL
jgi:tRNA threonylcarbamoyladenosine biosynthesis protein TsaB